MYSERVLEHFIHSYADYHAAARSSGLSIVDVREVSAAEGEAPVLLAIAIKLAAR